MGHKPYKLRKKGQHIPPLLLQRRKPPEPMPGRPSSLLSQPPELDFHLAGISPRRRAFSQGVVRLAESSGAFIGKHWMALVNGLLGLFIGTAFLAPVLAYFGQYQTSSWLLHSYHSLCDQIPSHSYYLFGHQVILCERCLAIYMTLLFGSLLFAAFPRLRRNIRPLDWRHWLLLMLPMALDGGTQLLGWRESDVILRTITGFLFGIATAWFILPRIQEFTPEFALQSVAQQ